MKTRILIAVEYISIKGEETKTFEIFETIKEAYEFGMKLKTWQNRNFFIADFNGKNIYKENDELNYEDNSDLYEYYIPINL